ncbi:AraC family transcriptional regulator [Aquimarina sp. I32.4]|uniref:helix-turn-helix domain-containing protein n=1 Tax=Aquimarina sp. I32.4 TaxID=2053903 RepID=UPI00130485F7|nr:AraC family transcriptional regulator [Aquimarina sp. I32.4]
MNDFCHHFSSLPNAVDCDLIDKGKMRVLFVELDVNDLNKKEYTRLNENLILIPTSKKPTISIHKHEVLFIKSQSCISLRNLFNTNSKFIGIFFNEDSLNYFLKKYYPEFTNTKGNKKESAISLVIDDYFENFVLSILNLYNLKTVSKHILFLKFLELMVHLKNSNKEIFSFFDKSNHTKGGFKNMLERNIDIETNVVDLIKLSNMSASSFRREFHKLYNTTPAKWLKKKKLKCAACLLKNNKKTPTDIYFDLGFESLSSFIFAFKNEFGTTPKQYSIDNDKKYHHPIKA